MPFLDLIVLLLVVASLVVAVAIVARKFPLLAALRLEHLPKHRQLIVKGRILERRLAGKAQVALRRIGTAVKPAKAAFGKTVQRVRTKLEDLEREYERQRQLRRPEDERRHQLNLLLTEAETLFGNGSFADAEKKYIEVVSHDPKHLDAYQGLGDVYLQLKEYDHAREVLEVALRLSDRIGTLDHEREHHGRLGRGAAAAPRTINSELAAINGDLAEAYAGLGRTSEAIAHVGEAVRLEPGNPRFLDRLTELAIASGDRRRASEALAKLKQVNPENQKIAEFEKQIESLPM